jgi:membrane protease YdiL (CAAX protease family)
MDAAVFALAFTAIAAIVFLASTPLDKRLFVTAALGAALYVGADDFVTGLPWVLTALKFAGTHWNWTGKLLSLALSALAIVTLRLAPDAVGLTLQQRNTKAGVIALLLFIVWGTSLGLLFKPGALDAETLLFQATMPGLSEELVYRGIVPAILLGLVRGKRPTHDTVPWVVIVSTAIVFGAWHGLRYSHGSFGFDVLSALFPFIGSIPGGWLRFKTGSLVFPILAHSVANVAFHLAGAAVA